VDPDEYTLTKIIGKFGEKYGFFLQMFSNENTFVKMSESFAHFDGNIFILRKYGKNPFFVSADPSY